MTSLLQARDSKDPPRQVPGPWHNVREVRRNRVRILEDIIDEYLEGYRVRYRSEIRTEAARPVWRIQERKKQGTN